MRFRLGNHELESDLRELTRDGAAIALQPQVFDLLLFLVENRDRVVSKDDLVAAVWDNRPISDSALNSRINAVRKALQDDGKAQRMIRTIPRKGFRFVGDCEELVPAARAAAKVRNTRARGRAIDDFSVVWRRACKDAGLEGRLFHDLRRSAARNMDRAGVSRHVAMQITGHKTEAMYRRYNIVSEQDIRAALVKTQAYLDTKTV